MRGNSAASAPLMHALLLSKFKHVKTEDRIFTAQVFDCQPPMLWLKLTPRRNCGLIVHLLIYDSPYDSVLLSLSVLSHVFGAVDKTIAL